MTGREEACIRLAKKVGLQGKTVLDIGCSIGWFPKIALDLQVREIYAIEPDLDKLSLAKKAAPKAIIAHGYAGSLEFPDNKFDVVTLLDVIEHIPKNTEEEVLKEISRVLKSRGYLILTTPAGWWVSKVTDPAWYFGHRHYSREKLEKMLKKAGFKIDYFAMHGGLWEVIGMLVLYITKWIFRIPVPFEEWFDIRRRREFEEPGKIHISLIARKTT